MKYGHVETERIYFSSNEAAEQVGVPVKVLHSWEKMYGELKPKISGAGKRAYRASDIEIAKRIKEEQSKASIFGDEAVNETIEAKPKAIKERRPKQNNASTCNKEFLREIRDNLQNALDKIKK